MSVGAMSVGSMSVASRAESVSALEKAKEDLRALVCATEKEIGLVARVFEGLAGHTDTILKLAAAIVGCVEHESVSSVSPKVQTLGSAAKRFIGDRLQATAGILEMVTTEVKLLHQLSLVARDQEVIAFEIKSLSVLTNIEVAHLGAVGAGFQYLANELSDFSRSASKDIQELASQTGDRREAIEETRSVLSAELPRQRKELARIEADLGSALAVVDSSLSELSKTPVQFKICMEDIARQIAGVVAAVQAHDITRQQIEHVQAAVGLLASRMRCAANSERGADRELSQTYAGLTIQIYQLRAIKETVASWASQIRTCMSGILKVSTSDVVGIGPMVLDQEREVSSQHAHIELLERESQAHGKRIQRNLGGLSNLMQVVSAHLQRSKSIGDRLRLLAFNSIVEASHLGTQADAMFAISTSIKEISAEWNRITGQSGHTLQEILNLVKQTDAVMKTFSEGSNEELREAQAQTRDCLAHLRTAAGFAAQQAQDMKAATEKMQARITEAGDAGDRLDACFGRIDAVLAGIEGVTRQLEIDRPEVKHGCDAAEVEKLFSAFYTTETERNVLHAALHGKALPTVEATFAGNSVELF